ncbi:hypothetical protein [Afipia clevelandensis]|uniref:Uncharacterized protein n=1 Tax=Afipia clevelandensis ATCC 49720 TaxID=883079 RepID=K8NYG7_9BRAD|nr:hypothetical protein [Afipia clevelandensis]EKS35367.1 hypothetical protein HMPREF9696_02639 [Afipia clevelandensis ATCC 49720]
MRREETMTLTLAEVEQILIFALDKELDEIDAEKFWEEAKARYPHGFRDF